MQTTMLLLALAMICLAVFSLGATIGYKVGKADGEDKVCRWYEAKSRKRERRVK